eukprot:CAMPEP_0119319952 /NCGR_PEP_ID=MMETSP1333-20130426/50912_1 /TAXON_ID=418940 /ORGANISM="Scyphosphaera apsteinii, Strain RCC1455" /LENGTH=817 /DNA_ID=CAMNT_0007326511 /DNA_START=148 /DNA_END=2601 /DNA_ORIENTATION=-
MITSFFKPKVETPSAPSGSVCAGKVIKPPITEMDKAASSITDTLDTEAQPCGRKRMRKSIVCDDEGESDSAQEIEGSVAALRKAVVVATPEPSMANHITSPPADEFDERVVVPNEAVDMVDPVVMSDTAGPCEGDNALEGEAHHLQLKQSAKSKAGAPSKGVPVAYTKYDPASAATWKIGKDVPYSFLAAAFNEIEEESKRLRMTEILANCFRTVIAVTPSQLLPVISLASNKIAAAYEGLELGIGDSILIKAVAESCGRSIDAIKSQLEEEGDLGLVALSSRARQVTLCKPKPLMVAGVLTSLKELAQASGKDVMTRKKEKIKHMLVSAQGKEAQYIIRALQGKMRIGLQESTVLTALAHAVVLTPPVLDGALVDPANPPSRGNKLKGEQLQDALVEAEALIKRVYCEMPSFEVLVNVLLKHGLTELPKHAHLTAGIPVKPMLAKPTKGISEVLDRFAAGRFTCEFKYDGERAQIHMLEGGTVKVFSRNSEDMTSKYPDIAVLVPRAVAEGVTSFILDAEAVAIDRENGEIRPFQILSTRKRKDASIDSIRVQVCVFAFDMLYLNGESMLQQPLLSRRERLRQSFNVIENEFNFAKSSDVQDEDGIADWLQESIKGNCEGLMVKTLETDATYEPSRRSLNWLKVKKDYLQGMTDSCDLVPIGGYFGKGKRTGVYGAYLLACYNEEQEEYQTVCKIGTGFSDAALEEHTNALNPKRIDAPRPYYRLPENAANAPDVWFEPCQVWEVMAADLSISPVHMAAVGLVDSAKGIALRFPRFLRVRDDKGPEDATNATQIAQMYRDQACTQVGAAADEDDFD